MNPKDYLKASISGVRFLVPSDDGAFGRNNIRHEYPDSDVHYIEDNGKLIREFNIEALLHGPDVKSQFLALEAALTTPGPKTLLHPWLGVKLVTVDQCSYRVTQKEAGLVRVSIPCCEAGSPAFPALFTGSAIGIGGLVSSAIIAMRNLFLSSYTIPTTPTSIAIVNSTLSTVANNFSGFFNSVKRMPCKRKELRSVLNVTRPEILADAIVDIYRAPVKDDDLSNGDLYDGWAGTLKKFETTELYSPFDVTTVDYKKRYEALIAIQAFTRGAALIHFCESAATRDYSTAEQAIHDRRLIIDSLASVSQIVLNDAHVLIDEIVTETIEYLSTLEVQLPKIETMRISDFPVGSLAYQLYGDDTDKTQTLIDINIDRNLMLYDDDTDVLRDG